MTGTYLVVDFLERPKQLGGGAFFLYNNFVLYVENVFKFDGMI